MSRRYCISYYSISVGDHRNGHRRYDTQEAALRAAEKAERARKDKRMVFIDIAPEDR